jgi:hypothetical protein
MIKRFCDLCKSEILDTRHNPEFLVDTDAGGLMARIRVDIQNYGGGDLCYRCAFQVLRYYVEESANMLKEEPDTVIAKPMHVKT